MKNRKGRGTDDVKVERDETIESGSCGRTVVSFTVRRRRRQRGKCEKQKLTMKTGELKMGEGWKVKYPKITPKSSLVSIGIRVARYKLTRVLH